MRKDTICCTVRITESNMEKKAEYRFNIILNPSDPMHKTAINALNNQGRHKSQFVVNAIVHYIMNDANAGKALVPDTEEMRSICREIITELMSELPQQPANLIPEDSLQPDTSDQEFDFGSITDTLKHFRKK